MGMPQPDMGMPPPQMSAAGSAAGSMAGSAPGSARAMPPPSQDPQDAPDHEQYDKQPRKKIGLYRMAYDVNWIHCDDNF